MNTADEIIKPALLQALKAEIEFMKNYPGKIKVSSTYLSVTFNPTSFVACFMGSFFKQREDPTLAMAYRNEVGGIKHTLHGYATYLELWGASHWTGYPDTVKQVASYINGTRKQCPYLFIDLKIDF